MPYETNGEYFLSYLRDEIYDPSEDPWAAVLRALRPTQREVDWVDAWREMATLQLSSRLIIGARRVAEIYDGADALTSSETKQLILQTMSINYHRVPALYDRLRLAVIASRRTISEGTRREIEGFSRREMPWCYLCGVDLTSTGTGAADSLTIDHVWPQALGGDSMTENLLPACKKCNERKADTASWVMHRIQQVVLGLQPSANAMATEPITTRFALQARTARVLATSQSISLKEAHIQLGRPDGFEVIDQSTAADFFNLRPNYR